MGLQLAKLTKIFNKTQAVLQPLPKFNEIGNRVLSRTTLPQKTAFFNKLGAPLGTSSAEKLIVEKNFGKQSVEIITFKNEKGDIVGRLRKNYKQGKLENSVESRYILKKHSNKYRKMNFADIQRQFFGANNELVKMERMKQDVSVSASAANKNRLTKMIYNAEKNNQGGFDGSLSILHKVSDKVEKELCLKLRHLEDGTELSQTVTKQLNVDNNILKDPYLTVRAMPDEFGIKTLMEKFKHRVGLENNKTELFYIKGDNINYINGLALDNKKIGIAVIPAIRETVDTIAHELRHFRQDELASKFFKQLWYKISGNKNYNSHEYKLSKLFMKYNLFQNPFPVTENSISIFKKWNNWGLENDAWHYANRYKAEFGRYSEQLAQEFPFTSKYFDGNFDYVDYLRFQK